MQRTILKAIKRYKCLTTKEIIKVVYPYFRRGLEDKALDKKNELKKKYYSIPDKELKETIEKEIDMLYKASRFGLRLRKTPPTEVNAYREDKIKFGVECYRSHHYNIFERSLYRSMVNLRIKGWVKTAYGERVRLYYATVWKLSPSGRGVLQRKGC